MDNVDAFDQNNIEYDDNSNDADETTEEAIEYEDTSIIITV